MTVLVNSKTSKAQRDAAIRFYFKNLNGEQQDWVETGNGVVDEDVFALAALLASREAKLAEEHNHSVVHLRRVNENLDASNRELIACLESLLSGQPDMVKANAVLLKAKSARL